MGCPGPKTFSLSIKLCPLLYCSGQQPLCSWLWQGRPASQLWGAKAGHEEETASWAELLWGRPDLAGRRLGCGWLIPLLVMAEGFSAHAAWHAYGWGFFVGWGWFFLSPFCMLGGGVSCPPEPHEDGLCCPCCLWYHGRGKEMGLCSLLGWEQHFYLWSKSVAANGLSAFPPGTCWASSLHLHIVFPKAGLVQGCSLGPDPGIQWESTGQRTAVGMGLTALLSLHPVEQAQRQCSLR